MRRNDGRRESRSTVLGSDSTRTVRSAQVLTTLHSILARYGIVLALLCIALVLSVANESFLSASNLINILRQVSINGILAVGMTFVILIGGIDLSVGSTLAFCGMLAASLASRGPTFALWPALLVALVAGASLGAFSGAIIAWLRLPAFVVTLGMLSAVRGLTLIESKGMPISGLSSGFKSLGQGAFAGIPVPVIMFGSVVLISWFVLRYTVYGRRLYAVGGNIRSARTCGINTGVVVFSVYVLMGLLSAIAGLILTARTTAALPQAGVSYELDAIAAVVIGGTSLTGGVGGVLLTVVGVLIIGLLNNGLDLLGVSSYYQQLIKGLMIIAAVLIDRARHAETH